MNSKSAIGLIMMFSSLVLVIGHLQIVGDLIPQGIDPDGYAESGGTALASRAAVPIGALGLSLGTILLFFGRGKQEAEASETKPPKFRFKASYAVMAVGAGLLLAHILMLRGLASHLDVVALQLGPVTEGSAFEAEKAGTAVSLERINAIFIIGLAVSLSGFVLSMNDKQKAKTADPE